MCTQMHLFMHIYFEWMGSTRLWICCHTCDISPNCGIMVNVLYNQAACLRQCLTTLFLVTNILFTNYWTPSWGNMNNTHFIFMYKNIDLLQTILVQSWQRVCPYSHYPRVLQAIHPIRVIHLCTMDKILMDKGTKSTVAKKKRRLTFHPSVKKHDGLCIVSKAVCALCINYFEVQNIQTENDVCRVLREAQCPPSSVVGVYTYIYELYTKLLHLDRRKRLPVLTRGGGHSLYVTKLHTRHLLHLYALVHKVCATRMLE